MIHLIISLIKKIKQYGIKKVIFFVIRKIIKKIKIEYIKKNIKKIESKKKIEFHYITSMNFFYDNLKKNKIKNYYDNDFLLKKEIIEDAEQILDHKFDLLGSGLVYLGENIEWNKDFKSNFIWKNKFYKDIKIVDLNNNADVKIPWELSRFQHLFTLGKAYWITDDKKYYLEAKKEIEDWINKNPIYMSINWTCAMDVAIRAVNWIFFYFHFKELIDMDKLFLDKFNNSLFQHGEYIYLNLEKGIGYLNNHYISDLTGLLYLGIYFKDLNFYKVKNWIQYAQKEIEKEMFIQNNDDGTNYETSTSYHRLVTELMFFSTIIAKKNNIYFSENLLNRLEKMFEFLSKIIKSNGKIPMIGDVDNGRLLIISNYYKWEVNDIRSLLSLGGEFFKNINLKKSGTRKKEEKLWIFNSLNEYTEEYFSYSQHFINGGYYKLQNKNIYCLIRCGELSCKGEGGHSHNDQLSFELNVNGEDFFIDPGTGVYTSDKNIRNLFRSTKMHNTVSLENIEQNNFQENELFEMREETFSKCLNIEDNYFEGEHIGYLKKAGVIHKRKILLEENKLIIEDFIENCEGIVCLNLFPNTKIKGLENIIQLENNSQKLSIEFPGNNYKIVDSYYSKRYGVIEKNKRIEIKFRNKIKIKVKNMTN